MKKFLAMLSVIVFVLSLVSCGTEESEEVIEIAESSSQATEETAEEITTTEESKEENGLQECHKSINNSEKPEVVMFSLTAECPENIKAHARVTDIFSTNYYHNKVVGLVGVPFELTYDEKVKNPKIAFTYDTDEFRGMPEKNLIVLHYDKDRDTYDTIKSELDTENSIISAEIKEDGVYLLADAYKWYACWDMDVSEYAYEVDESQYPTDWERENDTADIMKLADKKWAMENAPFFSVSTPEQLASVVWYVNGIQNEDIVITLEDDIDLSGYEWKSMGWDKKAFSGYIDGQNHTINGLSIHEGYCDTGFVGYGLGVSVNNISFTNANISATGCVGIVGGQLYMCGAWSNIHVSGVVHGGAEDYACIVGRETDITFKDCTADVTIDGEKFEYFSYRQKREDDVEIVETFHVTMNDDGTITRDDHDGFRNLGWQITRNDEHMLDRNAEGEFTYDLMGFIGDTPGNYKVCLTAYINGTYIRVSNLIEFEIS